MARKDLYHENVKTALEKEGWLITDDPLDLSVGLVELYADLGAERLIAATHENEKIAIEVKTFVGQGLVSEFHKAMGQYEHYKIALSEIEPDRKLYLAIPEEEWDDFFQRPFIQKVMQVSKPNIFVYNPNTQEITAWITH